MNTPKAIPELTAAEKARFWSKVDKNGPVPTHCPELGRCWIWTGSKTKPTCGYGQFFIRRGKTIMMTAHRVAYALAEGSTGAHILHRCDNTACVRRTHLFTGGQLENIRDMMAKGRFVFDVDPSKRAYGDRSGSRTRPEKRPRGEGHARSKLTDADVRNIREDYRSGIATQRELAARLAVSPTHIGRIITRKAWKHIT